MDNQSSGPRNHCANVALCHDFHATATRHKMSYGVKDLFPTVAVTRNTPKERPGSSETGGGRF